MTFGTTTRLVTVNADGYGYFRYEYYPTPADIGDACITTSNPNLKINDNFDSFEYFCFELIGNVTNNKFLI
jgi:hypothetical protein